MTSLVCFVLVFLISIESTISDNFTSISYLQNFTSFPNPPIYYPNPPISYSPHPLYDNGLNAGVQAEDDLTYLILRSLYIGNYRQFASVIDSYGVDNLPSSSTIFVPDDENVYQLPNPRIDPKLFQFHVIPQKFSFSELLDLPNGSILPTLAGKSLIITISLVDKEVEVNGVRVVNPDIFVEDSVAIHGISEILKWKVLEELIVSPPAPAHRRGVIFKITLSVFLILVTIFFCVGVYKLVPVNRFLFVIGRLRRRIF